LSSTCSIQRIRAETISPLQLVALSSGVNPASMGASISMSKLASLAEQIAEILINRGETVAVSESSGGGLVSAALLAVPGASAYFMGGAVTYTGIARDTFLGFNLDNHPGVRSASEPYALLCAKAVRARLRTAWGLSETGAAGPTGNRYGDAAGHTCVAVAGPAESTATLETGISDREKNMNLFAEKALEHFLAVLK
jgi:nicotinamide-nucleotide amidase